MPRGHFVFLERSNAIPNRRMSGILWSRLENSVRFFVLCYPEESGDAHSMRKVDAEDVIPQSQCARFQSNRVFEQPEWASR